MNDSSSHSPEIYAQKHDFKSRCSNKGESLGRTLPCAEGAAGSNARRIEKFTPKFSRMRGKEDMHKSSASPVMGVINDNLRITSGNIFFICLNCANKRWRPKDDLICRGRLCSTVIVVLRQEGWRLTPARIRSSIHSYYSVVKDR
jgi:hypothetical protein